MDLFKIASMITAVTTIIVGAWKIIKLSHKLLDKQEEIESRLAKLEQQVHMLGLMEDKLPIDDRLEYGEKFINSGGIGYPKAIYHALLQEVSSQVQSKKE